MGMYVIIIINLISVFNIDGCTFPVGVCEVLRGTQCDKQANKSTAEAVHVQPIYR